MATLTVNSPRTLNVHDTSPVKERKIEILPDGEVLVQIIYENDNKLLLRTANGSLHITSDELLLMESTPNKTDLTVGKQTTGKKVKPDEDAKPEKTDKATKEKRKKRGAV